MIKQELDTRGFYIHVYKADGYKSHSLIFEKHSDKYSVQEHLSTESGYEEDLDLHYESENFDDLINYVKSQGFEL